MKLARFTHRGLTRLGVVEGAEVADIGTAAPGLPRDVGEVIAAGLLPALPGLVAAAPRLALDDVHLEAPIGRPPEFLAVGLNFPSHSVEVAMETPEVPLIFNKQASCITGPGDPIELGSVAPDQVDYEGELGVVIGQTCRAVSPERALDVIAGYLVVNDVSVRDWQMATGTMTMGKSWDTHGPIGPWLVTPDEVADPHDLHIRTWVDGELRQEGHTADMIFPIGEIIAHLSTAFTLLPGTIVATGTPDGVGLAFDPPRFLRPGSRVRVEVEGIGVIDNPVVAAGPAAPTGTTHEVADLDPRR